MRGPTEPGPLLASPVPATPPVRGRQTGIRDYPLLKKGDFMENTKRCSSYRLRLKKLERVAVVLTTVMRLILLLLQIWTLIG